MFLEQEADVVIGQEIGPHLMPKCQVLGFRASR
jgi:hypothetical protein